MEESSVPRMVIPISQLVADLISNLANLRPDQATRCTNVNYNLNALSDA